MPSPLNPWRRFLMWRSGRGFGIHSPFAFRFVTEVLHQPYAYYSYADLGSDRAAHLLVRLMVAFKPGSVALVGCDDSLRRAVSLADSRVEIRDVAEGADFVVADCAMLSRAEVTALFVGHCRPHALLVNCRRLPDLTGYGMTFANSRGTVVVASHPHLPSQNFNLNF